MTEERVLTTPRLQLVPVSLLDLDRLACLYGDPQVTARTKLGRRNREQTAEILDGYLETWHANDFGMRLVFLRGDDSFIGECGLFGHDSIEAVALRYAFFPNWWGQGLASEAAEAVLVHTFMRGLLERVIAIAQKENRGSVRVMEKLGMTPVTPPAGFKSELVLYEILKSG